MQRIPQGSFQESKEGTKHHRKSLRKALKGKHYLAASHVLSTGDFEIHFPTAEEVTLNNEKESQRFWFNEVPISIFDVGLPLREECLEKIERTGTSPILDIICFSWRLPVAVACQTFLEKPWCWGSNRFAGILVKKCVPFRFKIRSGPPASSSWINSD